MKVSASVKRRCKDCRVIIRTRTKTARNGQKRKVRSVMIVCKDPRHKQRQG